MLTRSFIAPSDSNLLAYTPMFHARMFGEVSAFREKHFKPIRGAMLKEGVPPNAELHLDGNPAIDRPLFVQFCANNPDELLEAATYVAPYCDAVDLNLGCPQGIARRGNYGAFLQERQDVIQDMIAKLHKHLSVPVTAKIRILDTKEESLEYAKNVLAAGASILTVHGRRRDQKGHKTGLADWAVIKYLRDNLPPDTVLFANGNILQREDIQTCLEATGADGVMSAEGNLYDPTIFSDAPLVGQEGREYWRGRDGEGGFRMDAVMRRYLDIIYEHVLQVPKPSRRPLYTPHDRDGPAPAPPSDRDEEPPRKKSKNGKHEKPNNPSLLAMQPHLFHLLRSLVKQHHGIRDALARCRAGDVPAFEDVLQMVENVTRQALDEYEASSGQSWEVLRARLEAEASLPAGSDASPSQMQVSSQRTVRKCRRPWWIVQPYVRPLPTEALQIGALTMSKKELAREEKSKTLGAAASPTDAGKTLGAAASPTDAGMTRVDAAALADAAHNKTLSEATEPMESAKERLVSG
jgi:tRNA-dihydrouridine synthase 1